MAETPPEVVETKRDKPKLKEGSCQALTDAWKIVNKKQDEPLPKPLELAKAILNNPPTVIIDGEEVTPTITRIPPKGWEVEASDVQIEVPEEFVNDEKFDNMIQGLRNYLNYERRPDSFESHLGTRRPWERAILEELNSLDDHEDIGLSPVQEESYSRHFTNLMAENKYSKARVTSKIQATLTKLIFMTEDEHENPIPSLSSHNAKLRKLEHRLFAMNLSQTNPDNHDEDISQPMTDEITDQVSQIAIETLSLFRKDKDSS